VNGYWRKPLPEEISILDVVEKGGFEASLITTFNATLPFYEEVVLRRLRANGCRHNVVLMDRKQCAASWSNEATRPRQAGYDYSLIPITARGAFHPKIAIFAGPKKVVLLVGSHNLTLSGFGYNRELTNLIEIIRSDDTDAVSVLQAAWKAVAGWLNHSLSSCPEELIGAGLSMGKFLQRLLKVDASSGSTVFLSQSQGSQSLLDQLKVEIAFSVQRGLVMGAFFDEELQFLKALRAEWPEAKLTVAIDPQTVYLPTQVKDPQIVFINATEALDNGTSKYLHAKALYLEGREGEAVFVSGSSNPSGPGWGLDSSRANVEALVLLRGDEARDAARRTNLLSFLARPALDPAEINTAVSRTKLKPPPPTSPAVKLILGIANEETRTVTTNYEEAPSVDVIEALDEDDAIVKNVCAISSAGTVLNLTFEKSIHPIRSVRLRTSEQVVARVLVHHTAIINSSSGSTKQHQIRSAMGELGSSGIDISRLIERVSNVIFSNDVTKHASPVTRRDKTAVQPPSVRPESLSVHLDEITKGQRKKRLLQGGDLAYLLDILIHELHIPSTHSVTPVTEPGKDDDDGEDDEPERTPEIPSMSDAEIAEAVRKKVRTLVHKMVAREKLAATDTEQVTATMAQLLAVIALIKELRHLEMQGRWKGKGLILVRSDDQQTLLKKSMYYLFSSTHRLWHIVDNGDADSFEDLDDLNVLLNWLAWDLGYDFKKALKPVWEAGPENHEFALAGNAYLAKLLPGLVQQDQCNSLRATMQKTIAPALEEKKSVDQWLHRNVEIGRLIASDLRVSASQTSAFHFHIGGLAYVPNIIEPWSVILDVDDKLIHLWDFDDDKGSLRKGRGFLRRVAVPFQ